MAADITGAAQDVWYNRQIDFELTVTSASSPVGTLYVQVSTDNATWANSGVSSTALTANGVFYLTYLNGQNFRYVRLFYDRTSGSGTLACKMRIKQDVVASVEQSYNVTITADTNSTSKDTGCLVLEGGLGVQRDVYLGNNAAIAGTLTVTGATTQTGALTIADTTQSTDKDTGCLILQGGIGVEKNANVGGALGVTGAVTISSATSSTTKDTGALILASGGLGVEENVNIGGTLAVTGVSSFAAGAEATPSIIPSGDPNTGFWFPAADTIAGSTGGTERLRIASDGKIGIGTNNPQYLLEVNTADSLHLGNLYIVGTASNPTLASGSSAGSVTLGNNNGNGQSEIITYEHSHATYPKAIRMTTDNVERLRITSTGNLLVGGTTDVTTGTKALNLYSGTDATAVAADSIAFQSKDVSAGNTTLSLWTEGTPVSVGAAVASTHKVAMYINGTLYYVLVSNV